MHTIFALMRFFPYWAFPLALLCGELGWFYHRKRDPLQYLFWIVVFGLVTLLVLWIGFRGDLNSDRWVRAVFM